MGGTQLDDLKSYTPTAVPENHYNPFENETEAVSHVHDRGRDVDLDISYPPRRLSAHEREISHEETALHPPDRGKPAMMFLLSAFVLDVMVWGWGFA